mmetsp:Transcript_121843/g.316268  ORF Transcript_121843/g.316268 Transcript_121843/m.316268 type:complete len:233 (+) Transcript_121843:1664-2362(+)
MLCKRPGQHLVLSQDRTHRTCCCPSKRNAPRGNASTLRHLHAQLQHDLRDKLCKLPGLSLDPNICLHRRQSKDLMLHHAASLQFLEGMLPESNSTRGMLHRCSCMFHHQLLACLQGPTYLQHRCLPSHRPCRPRGRNTQTQSLSLGKMCTHAESIRTPLCSTLQRNYYNLGQRTQSSKCTFPVYCRKNLFRRKERSVCTPQRKRASETALNQQRLPKYRCSPNQRWLVQHRS